MNGVDGEYVVSNAQITNFMQGWQRAFVRKGQLGFDAEKIKVHRSMLNWGFFPEEHYDKWYAKLEEINMLRKAAGKPPFKSEQFPLQAYLVNLIKQGLIDEEEEQVVGKGFYKETVANKAQRTLYSTNGLFTELKRLIKEGKVLVLMHATFADDSVINFVEDFVDQVDDKYQMKHMKLLTSIRYRRKYGKNFKDNFADGIAERKGIDLVNKPLYVEDTNTEIVGLPGWKKLKTMVLTPKDNIIKVWSEYMRPIQVKVPIEEHLVIGNWGRGYGYALPRILFVAGEVIEPPRLISLSDATQTSFKMKLEEVAHATSYRFDVATDANFDNVIKTNAAFDTIEPDQETFILADDNESYTFNVNQLTGDLNADTMYFVRARAELTPISGENQGKTYPSQNSKVLRIQTAPHCRLDVRSTSQS